MCYKFLGHSLREAIRPDEEMSSGGNAFTLNFTSTFPEVLKAGAATSACTLLATSGKDELNTEFFRMLILGHAVIVRGRVVSDRCCPETREAS